MLLTFLFITLPVTSSWNFTDFIFNWHGVTIQIWRLNPESSIKFDETLLLLKVTEENKQNEMCVELQWRATVCFRRFRPTGGGTRPLSRSPGGWVVMWVGGWQHSTDASPLVGWRVVIQWAGGGWQVFLVAPLPSQGHHSTYRPTSCHFFAAAGLLWVGRGAS